MRAAVIALGLIVIALIARADVTKQAAPAGFDHARHAQATTLACTQCHSLERGGSTKAPSHATCFGKCHAEQATTLKLKEPVPDDRLRYCNACHAETALVVPIDRKALALTAVRSGVEHGLQLGHNSHAQIACAKCHEPGRPRKGRPHERCIACHNDKTSPTSTFAISECAKCHPTGGDRPHLIRSQVVVTSTFSHAKHAGRGAAKQCTTCHAGVAATDARALPSPKVETCATAGCHDGKAGFGVLTVCTKCHVDVPKTEFKVARPSDVFSHARHEPQAKPCGACHPLSKSGEVHVVGHLACVEGCHKHEDELGARWPTICGACHDGTEPWRALIADKIPSDTTEFGASLDHDKHRAACASCHTLTTTRTELRPPRGHRSCTTAGCHAVTGGPAPQMTACEGCHQGGLQIARETARLSARWSVRATFTHRVHAEKLAVECVRCHSDLTSPKLLSLPAPAKATCSSDGCHDGRGAFKVTGTSCTRCHPGAKK